MKKIKLIECPRDAMQGWGRFIPTESKINYLNQLLKVGFDTLDFGSFVSHKAIPQMEDTREVVQKLDLRDTQTKLLAIIANVRGAEEAAIFDEIYYLGFPFSISPTFQMRNANGTLPESLDRVKKIIEICNTHGKEPVIYISMAFGNPYGDFYSGSLVLDWIERLLEEGITIISLADTVGLATPADISSLVKKVIARFPRVETGVHLHSTAFHWQEKIDAALTGGCLRFDGALKGYGGCPMAEDELIGNMNSELMIPYFQNAGLLDGINEEELNKAGAMATQIFL